MIISPKKLGIIEDTDTLGWSYFIMRIILRSLRSHVTYPKECES